MERNVLIDKLKGYACFLVLFGHVIMGIRVSDVSIPSVFEGVEKFIWSFHVALFLFLSGVVYHVTGEWRGKKTKLGFMKHKLINLGVPYVVFSVVYILINSLVGESNTNSSIWDIFRIATSPVAQYWFLYALFFLFCIWAGLGGILKNWQIAALVVLISYLAPALGISLGCFEVVFYSGLAFGVGTFVKFEKITKISNLVKWLVVLSHLAVGILLIKLNRIEDPWVKEFMVLFGIYSSILFISLIQNSKLVARFLLFINKYSFQIYLLHTIFTAGIRIILLRVGIGEWWIHVVVGTICGLVFSVLAAFIAEKIKFLNFFFFPTKTLKLSKRRTL